LFLMPKEAFLIFLILLSDNSAISTLN
jgi:hypothetical protein